MKALITGASSGIGKELALRLADQGYDLILIARRKERLASIKDACSHVHVDIFPVDLTDFSQVDELINQLKDIPIDLFINNAGYGTIDHSIKIDTDKELDMIDLNIKSLHKLTKFAIHHMDKGKIVNLASMAAYLPTPKMASYAATKAYVSMYSQALNYELKKLGKNIQVVTVSPGPVKTEFADVAGVKQKMKGMPVEKCVRIILKELKKNKSLIIPGFQMKFLKFIIRFVPKKLLLYSANKFQSKK